MPKRFKIEFHCGYHCFFDRDKVVIQGVTLPEIEAYALSYIMAAVV